MIFAQSHDEGEMKFVITMSSWSNLHNAGMSSPAELAHVLRRTTFGPRPGQLAELDGVAATDLVDRLLEAEPLPVADPPGLTNHDSPLGPELWWLRQMARPEAGLHEKLVWFWHGHFATSVDKVGDADLMWGQHQTLRKHALGNFRDLLYAITVDPAMLRYLDGDNSVATGPNENYAREMMELFALGHGHYTQADVSAGARGLAGWTVDSERGTASFDEESAYPRPLTFLGRHGRLRTSDVIDAVCDDLACAAHVAERLFRFFCGVEPTNDRRTALGDLFRSNDLEIAPLVAAILRSDEFMQSSLNRARQPVEWVTAAIAALGLPDDGDTSAGADPSRRLSWCERLDQVPFHPPNVSGWPAGTRWLSGGFALVRTRLALEASTRTEIVEAEDPVAAVLDRCSIVEVSGATRGALMELFRSIDDFSIQSRLLLAAAVASPEFALA